MTKHPMVFLGPRDFRQVSHVFDRCRAKFFRNYWQEMMPHAIAEESDIAIRRIFQPALAFITQKSL